MLKIPVIKCYQKRNNFYLLKYDPRKIIKLVKIPQKDTDQLNQRPWKEERAKEISKYCAGLLDLADGEKKVLAKGIIPNCPILNILDSIRIVEKDDSSYIELPDSDDELKEFNGKLEIIDGQHRLIAFSDEYIDQNFKNSERYEMGFVVFNKLTMEAKREIFMISNEKQEKVESNVLRQIKKWLGLLSEDEEQIYDLVTKLNIENISPLKGKIIIGGNRVKHGFKLVQVIKIFDKSKTFELIKNSSNDQKIKSISNYLAAWQDVYSGMYNNPRHMLGKISGLRYIFYLFPYVFEIMKEKIQPMTSGNIKDVLQNLYDNLLAEEDFKDEKTRLLFRAETATISLARIHGAKLKEISLNSENIFSPLEDI